MDAIKHSDWSFEYLPRHLIGSLTSTIGMTLIPPVTNNAVHQAAGARPKIDTEKTVHIFAEIWGENQLYDEKCVKEICCISPRHFLSYN